MWQVVNKYLREKDPGEDELTTRATLNIVHKTCGIVVRAVHVDATDLEPIHHPIDVGDTPAC